MFGSLTGLAVSRSRLLSATTCRAAVDGTPTLSSSGSLREVDLFESLTVFMGACMLSSKGGSAVLIPPKPLPGVAGVFWGFIYDQIWPGDGQVMAPLIGQRWTLEGLWLLVGQAKALASKHIYTN